MLLFSGPAFPSSLSPSLIPRQIIVKLSATRLAALPGFSLIIDQKRKGMVYYQGKLRINQEGLLLAEWGPRRCLKGWSLLSLCIVLLPVFCFSRNCHPYFLPIWEVCTMTAIEVSSLLSSHPCLDDVPIPGLLMPVLTTNSTALPSFTSNLFLSSKV